MTPTRVVISDFKTGFERDKPDFLLNNDAFAKLQNAFIWRNRLRKKPGVQQLGRLRRCIEEESQGNITTPWITLSGTLSNTPVEYDSLDLYSTASITGATNNNPCQLTVTQNYTVGQFVTITDVGGMTQLNGNTYEIVARTATTIDIDVDSTTFGTYTTGGSANVHAQIYRTITDITNASPAVVTSADHNIPNGSTVALYGIKGMTLTSGNQILSLNGQTFTTANATTNTFELSGTDTVSYSSYGSGGTASTFHDPEGGNYSAQFYTGFNDDTAILADYCYFPSNPVMGIEYFDDENKTASSQVNRQETVFFDTTYAYEFIAGSFVDASFYRNTNAPVIWHGADYQQFWSTNYQNAMFVSNNVPGMHGVTITNITSAGTARITTSVNHNLTTDDFVFIAETTGTDSDNLNNITFQVTDVPAADEFEVNASTAGGINNVGIVQYLTRTSPSTSSDDGIRWFDGLDTSAPFDRGFVNFAPPLDNLSSSATTYLVGARMIVPFGGRLLAIGTYESTSGIIGGSAPTYYPNRIRYCQVNGTCFYANNPSGGTATADSWISNIQGFGGFIDLDSSERIITAGINQDVLILGQETQQKKLQITNSDTLPFTVQTINSEYGSESTHATIVLDQGILTVGDYGYIMTSTYNAQRFDNIIPDQIYEIKQTDNGNERVTGIRDFQNQLIYFTYPQDVTDNTFPNRTLLFNYKENNFAVFKESYTTYGIFRRSDGIPWENIDYLTWDEWQIPWELNVWQAEFPTIAAGNQQGYIMQKNFQGANDPSLYISAVSGQTVTSPDHNLDEDDYVGFQDIGSNTLSSINRIASITSTDDIEIEGSFTATAGLTEMVIIDNFDIITKRFPMAWKEGRKTRLGTSRYYTETTNSGEYTVDILVNQEGTSDNDPSFSSLVSSNIVRTRPDDDLGFSGQRTQEQRSWHRIPTSAVGDTIQLRLRMNDDQMKDVNINTSMWFLYAMVLDFYPSRILI